jgi:signal transduction histidine kinase
LGGPQRDGSPALGTSTGGVIPAIVAELASEFEGMKLKVRMPNIARPVEFDRDMIKHVLRLLLENAGKYAPYGLPVVISGRSEGDSAIIGVGNFGSAIPADERERIFEKYYRGRGNRRTTQGSGLGLSIARRIVRAHGGDMGVESAPRRGTEFHFSLPFQEPVG